MTERRRECHSFWEMKPATLQSMLLHPKATQIDLEERPEIFNYLPSFDGKDVLELAAGIGRFTGPFAAKASHVTAVDFVQQFIEQNRKHHAQFSNITYQCADVMDLEYPPASFDLIFINWLLMYLADVEVEALACRLVSWLRPGGHLFFRESCSSTHQTVCSPCKGYFVRYRSLFYYTQLFKNLELVHTENIEAYETWFANPFQGFWLLKSLSQ